MVANQKRYSEMRKNYLKILAGILLLSGLICGCNKTEELKNAKESGGKTTDALPSWNDGDAKKRIITFVQNATDSASKSYIPKAERIAVFDNDGTLWNEVPVI